MLAPVVRDFDALLFELANLVAVPNRIAGQIEQCNSSVLVNVLGNIYDQPTKTVNVRIAPLDITSDCSCLTPLEKVHSCAVRIRNVLHVELSVLPLDERPFPACIGIVHKPHLDVFQFTDLPQSVENTQQTAYVVEEVIRTLQG